MFVVTLSQNGKTWFLRSPIVTEYRERATTFTSQEAALAALAKASTFHKKAFLKTAAIIAA